MKIGVIGIGKLGLSFALLLEKSGFKVTGSDISQEYNDKINNKVKFLTMGRFHKGWVQGTKHRDSPIRLCPMPRPNFWEAFYWHKSLAQGRRVQKSL